MIWIWKIRAWWNIILSGSLLKFLFFRLPAMQRRDVDYCGLCWLHCPPERWRKMWAGSHRSHPNHRICCLFIRCFLCKSLLILCWSRHLRNCIDNKKILSDLTISQLYSMEYFLLRNFWCIWLCGHYMHNGIKSEKMCNLWKLYFCTLHRLFIGIVIFFHFSLPWYAIIEW